MKFGIVLAFVALGAAPPSNNRPAEDQSICPHDREDRTALEVWNDHLAAIQSGNIALIACDYAEDATVVMPGTVISGKANVLAAFEAFAQLLGGQLPSITSVTASGQVVLVDYTLDSPHVVVPLGVDTFVVKEGLIRYQTVHATIEFR